MREHLLNLILQGFCHWEIHESYIVIATYSRSHSIESFQCSINKFEFSVSERLKNVLISLIEEEVENFSIIIENRELPPTKEIINKIIESESEKFSIGKVVFEKIPISFDKNDFIGWISSICIITKCIDILNQYYGFDEEGNMICNTPFKKGDIVRLKTDSSSFFIQKITFKNMIPIYHLIKMDYQDGKEAFSFNTEIYKSDGSDMIPSREITIAKIIY